MKISERLNFVIPLYGEDEATITGYVHSAPISRSAFEAHHALIARTFTSLFSNGYGEISGPRVAALLLKDMAKRWEEDADSLLQEIERLSCLIRPGPTAGK